MQDIKRAVLGNLLAKYYKYYKAYLDTSGAMVLNYVKVTITAWEAPAGRRRALLAATSATVEVPIPTGVSADASTSISSYVSTQVRKAPCSPVVSMFTHR